MSPVVLLAENSLQLVLLGKQKKRQDEAMPAAQTQPFHDEAIN
jgi:hypothetical protein